MSTTASPILEKQVSTNEINEFVNTRLGPAVDGQPITVVHAGLLTLLLNVAAPYRLTQEEVSKGITDTSAWLSMYLSTLREETVQ